MSIIEINDIRKQKDFKGVTFSNYKLSDVKKELLKTMVSSKIESACYWGVELICSGYFMELWDILFLYISKYVHIKCAKMPIYIELRLNMFKQILNNGYSDSLLELRNNSKIRHLFCELILVLSITPKCHSFNDIKIQNNNFDLSYISHRIKATSINFAKDIFLEDDPKELYNIINELMYCINSEIKNEIDACYWVEWLIEYNKLRIKQKEPLLCERRTFSNIDDGYQKDIIWVIWDCIINEGNKREKIISKIINSSINLFSLKYKSSYLKNRKYFIYFMISLLCSSNLQYNDIIKNSDKSIIENALINLDSIYCDIKKNEVSPNTEYLFKDTKETNLKKTIDKLEHLDDFGEKFIPRI